MQAELLRLVVELVLRIMHGELAHRVHRLRQGHIILVTSPTLAHLLVRDVVLDALDRVVRGFILVGVIASAVKDLATGVSRSPLILMHGLHEDRRILMFIVLGLFLKHLQAVVHDQPSLLLLNALQAITLVRLSEESPRAAGDFAQL